MSRETVQKTHMRLTGHSSAVSLLTVKKYRLSLSPLKFSFPLSSSASYRSYLVTVDDRSFCLLNLYRSVGFSYLLSPINKQFSGIQQDVYKNVKACLRWYFLMKFCALDTAYLLVIVRKPKAK
jgi:hypothetical protein